MSDRENLPSVVFDCMVFLQSLIKEANPAVACLELFEKGDIKLFISDEILVEICDVLTRPKLQARYPLLTNERAGKLIEILREKAEFIENVPRKFTYPRDPKDEPYINLAIAANADYIVSRDKDLLDLMTGHTKECKEFRQRFRRLKVIEPQEFLKTASPSKEK
ncbi:MAG: putative toxin-antitoxin system toxin component, PIN family [Blastocatellia bacterium]|nr:putative toxin-antitoxin system toxin component, PIN family [Blastocatellia bacterium]